MNTKHTSTSAAAQPGTTPKGTSPKGTTLKGTTLKKTAHTTASNPARIADAYRFSSQSKSRFVNELADGARVDTYFVLASKEARKTEAAGHYLLCELRDRTGSIAGIQFNKTSFADIPPQYSVVRVAGRVLVRGRQKRIRIESMEPVAKFNPSDFIASAQRPLKEMREEYVQHVYSIKNPKISALVKSTLKTRDFFDAYTRAPRSESGPGSYISGALDYTLKLCGILDRLAELYPQANRDTLMAAALLGHVGCVDAFRIGAGVELTREGRQTGIAQLSAYRMHEALLRYQQSKDAFGEVERIINYRIVAAGNRDINITLYEQAVELLYQAEVCEIVETGRMTAAV